MSVTSHGNITLDNLDEAKRKTAIYGPKRVTLSIVVKEILEELKATWTIDGGTLMGAWRDKGKMLEHDDDFDFVIYAHGIDHHEKNRDKKCHQFILQLMIEFEKRLPYPYKCRPVTTYCKKLEIYNPEEGKYDFSPLSHIKTNYHNVTCDLMVILSSIKEPRYIFIQHEKMRHVRVKYDNFFSFNYVFPKIYYEGNKYNCPHNPEGYLKDLYGYIGKNAVYDPETHFYIPLKDKIENINLGINN